jgi:hypothetical protein
MHQSEFNLKEYLQAFNIIISKGTKVENHYSLLEVNAWHDFDGYTRDHSKCMNFKMAKIFSYKALD